MLFRSKGCVFGAISVQALEYYMIDLVHYLAGITGYDDAILTASMRPILFGAFTVFFLYVQPLGLAYIFDQVKYRIAIWPRNP